MAYGRFYEAQQAHFHQLPSRVSLQVLIRLSRIAGFSLHPGLLTHHSIPSSAFQGAAAAEERDDADDIAPIEAISQG